MLYTKKWLIKVRLLLDGKPLRFYHFSFYVICLRNEHFWWKSIKWFRDERLLKHLLNQNNYIWRRKSHSKWVQLLKCSFVISPSLLFTIDRINNNVKEKNVILYNKSLKNDLTLLIIIIVCTFKYTLTK